MRSVCISGDDIFSRDNISFRLGPFYSPKEKEFFEKPVIECPSWFLALITQHNTPTRMSIP